MLSHATTNVPDSALMVDVRFEIGTPPQNVAFGIHVHARFSHVHVYKAELVLDKVWVHGEAEQENCSTPA